MITGSLSYPLVNFSNFVSNVKNFFKHFSVAKRCNHRQLQQTLWDHENLFVTPLKK